MELLSLPPLTESREGAAAGRSFVALLSEDRESDGPVFSEKVERTEVDGAIQAKAVRMGDWKYIRRYAFTDGGTEEQVLRSLSEELYDLKSDPNERVNLISFDVNMTSAPPLDRLRAELLSFCAEDVRFEELAKELQARRDSLELTDPETLRILESLGY